MPSRGLIGCRSIATILTSFRGLSSGSFSDLSSTSSFASSVSVLSPEILSICCRNTSCLSSHAERPNFSPLIKTLDKTWLQLPGAAQRSTTRVTSAKRSNSAVLVSWWSIESYSWLYLHRAEGV